MTKHLHDKNRQNDIQILLMIFTYIQWVPNKRQTGKKRNKGKSVAKKKITLIIFNYK